MMNSQLSTLSDIAPGLVGRRLTPQRQLLLDLIRQGGHLDVDELYRQAKEMHPQLSMSTVYRNLQLFLKLGLVEEHHFNKIHRYYEVKSKVAHHHLICLGCGKIIEFKCSLSREIIENLETRNEFHITGAKVLLAGYCDDCFKRRGNSL